MPACRASIISPSVSGAAKRPTVEGGPGVALVEGAVAVVAEGPGVVVVVVGGGGRRRWGWSGLRAALLEGVASCVDS